MNITIGHDPEFHVFDRKRKKFVNAIPLVGHDKNDPVDLGDGVKFYHDNILVECSFPPGESNQQVIGIMRDAFRKMQAKLGPDYLLVPKASVMYDEQELGPKPKVMHGELPIPWEIGCNPSFDAYEITQKKPDPFTDGMRTGSFHIHIGAKELCEFHARHFAVKLLDIFVGVSSVLSDRDKTAKSRRRLYGRAGEFRPTDYGLEYRVLGPFAMSSPSTTELTLDLVRHALGFMDRNEHEALLAKVPEKAVRECINTSHRGLARSLLGLAGMPKELLQRVLSTKSVDFHQAWAI